MNDIRVYPTSRGIEVVYRPAASSDEQLLREFFMGLSPARVGMRIGLEYEVPPEREVERFLESILAPDDPRNLTIAAFLTSQPRIIGVGQYAVSREEWNMQYPEIGIVVSDQYPTKGIGRVILEEMVRYAKNQKWKGLSAWIRRDNILPINLVTRTAETGGISVEKKVTCNSLKVLLRF